MSIRLENRILVFILKRFGLVFVITIFFFGMYGIFLSNDPATAFFAFIRGPFISISSFLTALERTSILVICTIGAAVSFKSGLFNLGGEGQIYLGALSAALAGIFFPDLPFPIAPIFVMLAGILAGILVAFPSAVIAMKHGSDVFLISFLSSQAIIPIIDWAIAVPFKSSQGNLVATQPVSEHFMFSRMAPPSTLTFSFVIALFLVLFFSFREHFTKTGFSEKTYGKSPDFAVSVGLAGRELPLKVLCISGALHGLAGACLVLSTGGRAIRGMSGGLGWNALGAAMLAGLDAAICLPAAFFFIWIDVGANGASILSNLSYDAGFVLKAFIIIAAAIQLKLHIPRGFSSGSGKRETNINNHRVRS